MLPRWHILFGAIFSILIYFIIPSVGLFNSLLIFFSSFLIDFDHYLAGAIRIKSWNIGKILRYHDKLQKEKLREKKKSDFHIFHTIEAHIGVLLMGVLWSGFFYVFIGMVFHSLVDLYDGLKKGWISTREFFLIRWINQRLFKNN